MAKILLNTIYSNDFIISKLASKSQVQTYTARITCACGLHQKNRCENGLPKKMSTTKLKINSKGASLNDKIHSSSYNSAFMGYERMNLFVQSNNCPLHILSNFEIMISKPEM